MASRREQKEQARAARLAAAEVAGAAATRRRRLLSFGGIIATAVIALVVVIAIGTGSGGSGLQSTQQARKTYALVQRELAGIPQHGVRLGDPRAKVTMSYIGDLECPYCRIFTISVLPQFISSDVRSDKVKLDYRSLCTASCHFNTSRFVPQQVAAYAAGRQNLFWQYAELFYREQQDESQPYVTEHFLRGLAGQIPKLDLTRWLTDRKDPALTSQVQADQTFVAHSGLPEQTPEISLTGPRGTVSLPAEAVPTLTWLTHAVSKVS
ncbi:MAG TPA: thioredoxin domain-containing protein [Solirubrobacteraceae bacterium]|nr:thioredoxin domain-containing protein [Solirubrobacteraceae bacterium]